MRRGLKRSDSVFFLKIHPITIAFILHLLYSHLCFPSPKDLGAPRKYGFFLYFKIIFSEKHLFFVEINCFFKRFLRIKTVFSGGLNRPLPFQHRNKMEFLCVM